MKNQTTCYKNRRQIRISIVQTVPTLLRLKRERNKTAFSKFLLNIIPHIQKYIVQKLKTAVQKNHFKKNKYDPNKFLNQLSMETYERMENFSNEDEFYVWLYKKTNKLLANAIIEEEFDDLFFKNINNYSIKAWDQMEEKFTTESDINLVLKKELDDISYYKNPYTVNDVFIENTKVATLENIDECLKKEQIYKHVLIVLHFLPIQTRNVFELFTKHHLSVEEIALIRNISISKCNQLLDGGRKSLRASLFNRCPIIELETQL